MLTQRFRPTGRMLLSGTAPCFRIDVSGPDEMTAVRVLSLPAARRITMDPEADPALRDTVWRRLLRLARQDRSQDPDRFWSLAAIWVMLPGLRRTAGRLAHYSRADTQDISSAVLLGALEALHSTDVALPGLADQLWRAASKGGRRLTKDATREYPVDDLETARRLSGAGLDEPSSAAVPVYRGVPHSWEETGAGVVRREGERLGAVAHRLGLGATVRTARQCTGTRSAARHTCRRTDARASHIACRNEPS
ncbi:hypothetical protein ACFP1Z_30280 [Streptomyces gamaensis]|uniref:Uncharacterized protein n=1 Tax=Streptomyces gamaensis TaxID=1763542 RepID=A0ABW0Z6Y8_9ACTN